MNKKILVIGGGGYVGSMLVPKIIERGHSVTVFDLFIYGNFLKNHKNLKIIKGDIRNLNQIKETLSAKFE